MKTHMALRPTRMLEARLRVATGRHILRPLARLCRGRKFSAVPASPAIAARALRAGGPQPQRGEGGSRWPHTARPMSPAVADDDDAARLPRVLCLTGTASGQRIMEVQLSRLLREAKGRVEFVIYEGERDCTMPEPLEIMSAFFKGLPMKMYDELTFDERNWRCYKDVRGTLATLQRVLKTQGPFDGVLGFSQGANFAVMLAAQSYTGAGQPFSFVVPMCPNAPGYVGQLPELFEDPRLSVSALGRASRGAAPAAKSSWAHVLGASLGGCALANRGGGWAEALPQSSKRMASEG